MCLLLSTKIGKRVLYKAAKPTHFDHIHILEKSLFNQYLFFHQTSCVITNNDKRLEKNNKNKYLNGRLKCIDTQNNTEGMNCLK